MAYNFPSLDEKKLDKGAFSGSTAQDLQDNIDLKIPLNEKGVANGVVPLNASVLIDPTYLTEDVRDSLHFSTGSTTWNAASNTPTLASGSGEKGQIYVVTTSGTTSLNGITEWRVNDFAVFDGLVWRKINNNNAVESVNSQVGDIDLTTDDVPEGTGGTNLYFTVDRVTGITEVADAIDKRHDQNTDTFLDLGGANQIGASGITAHIANDTIHFEIDDTQTSGATATGVTWSANKSFIELATKSDLNHASRHIAGGDDEIDGDRLHINYNPTYYTPVTGTPEVSLNEELTAHLAGIDENLNVFKPAIVTTTASVYNIDETDYTLLANPVTTGSTITVNLPAANTVQRQIYNVKNIGVGNVVIDPNASEEIDGTLTYTISNQFDNIKLQSDGSNWWIL